MKRPVGTSRLLWPLVCVASGTIGVAAAMQTGEVSHLVFAAACTCFAVVTYRRSPFRVFANDVPATEERQVDVISIVGLLFLAASLILRYVVPAA